MNMSSIEVNSDAISTVMDSMGTLSFQAQSNLSKSLMNEQMVSANAEKIDMNVMNIATNSFAIAAGGTGMGADLSSLSMAVSTNEKGISTLEEADAMTMTSLAANT